MIDMESLERAKGIEPSCTAWEKPDLDHSRTLSNDTNHIVITLDTAFVQKCDFGAAKV